jgi:signal transduction histidine kinase
MTLTSTCGDVGERYCGIADLGSQSLGLAALNGSEEEQRFEIMRRFAALGEMAGGIVHDFRNVLAVVESGLKLAERNAGEPDTVRASIAGAREGLDHGLNLTSQLLAFAKLPTLNPQSEDANKLLSGLERLLSYAAGPGVRMVLHLAPSLPKCRIEPSQFSAAVLNLVLNARDAMPNGGEVRVSTERWEVGTASFEAPAPGAYVRVRVTDNGQGMSPVIAQRIFDPFFTTKGDRGTGLGLSQVCAFMRFVGGYVGVVSEPGLGTSFDLLFPLAASGEIHPPGDTEFDGTAFLQDGPEESARPPKSGGQHVYAS